MARALSPERQAEYERDKAFTLYLAAVLDEVIKHEPPGRRGTPGPDGALADREAPKFAVNLAANLRESLARTERQAPARTHAGLREARNDLLEITRAFPPELVAAIDADLTRQQLPTLSAVRAQVWQLVPKVLRRGRIRTEAEYYVIIECVNDQSGADGLTDADRARLAGIAAEFEERVARRRGGAA